MNPDVLAKIQAAQPNPSLDLPTAIHRYLNGESMQVLAKELGVARQTLYKWMLSDVGPDSWQTLKRDALIQRIADADAEMDESSTTEDIARSREKMRFARMDYERRFPKLYGAKQQMDIDNRITVVVNKYVDITPDAPQLSSETPQSQDNQ